MAGPKFPGSAELRVSAHTDTVVPWAIDYTTATGTYTIPVKGGTFALNGGSVVTTAFDASGVALTTGDGDDADGFQDSTDAALTVAATGGTPAVKLWSNSGNPYANGKYYAADDTIDFAWTKGTSGTAGVLKGFARLFSIRNGNVAASATAT